MRWAQVEDGIVLQVTVSKTEQYGADWLIENVGGVWCAVPEGMAVSPGFAYDEELGRFIPEKVFPSWVLNDETLIWEAPIATPEDGKIYGWNEEAGDWIEVTDENS